tara:strand:+ start:151 stop:570 length:420 start_codon:yes stop_codon:yes gene_type:complete
MNNTQERIRVLCCGTFDYLHRGHESFLRQASALGDELYVVIARDSNVVRIKGRIPDHNELMRKTRVEDLGIAQKVVMGNEGLDLLQVVGELSPDVIALGYDQNCPKNLITSFPTVRIERLDSFEPEKFKSSVIRKQFRR